MGNEQVSQGNILFELKGQNLRKMFNITSKPKNANYNEVPVFKKNLHLKEMSTHSLYSCWEMCKAGGSL